MTFSRCLIRVWRLPHMALCSVPQLPIPWAKLEKGVQLSPGKLVSDVPILIASVRLRSWVLLVTKSFLVKQITLLDVEFASHTLFLWSNANLFCLLQLWGKVGRGIQSLFGF